MYATLKIIHLVSVIIFLLIYFVKTILLISNKEDALTKLTKALKVPEMIVSFAFLATGIYLLTQVGEIKPLLIAKIGLVFLSIPIAVIGFKKRNKILGALALLMITGAYGMAEIAAKQSKKVDVAESNAAVMYEAKCGTCHGADGKLGLSGAMDISTTTLSKDSIQQIITNGRGMMPKTDLSQEQAAAVAEYVLSTVKK